MVGETNRVPFDLPEGEGEIVAGHMTEYSSMKFAMFFLAEYINMVTVSALATTLFLGGWRAPWPISLWSGANSGWWPVLWFLVKVFILLFCYVWLRGTLPRMRYDQLMALGWKILIPASIVWILLIATVKALAERHPLDRRLRVGGAGHRADPATGHVLGQRGPAARRRARAGAAASHGWRATALVEGFPVPPLDLPHYHGA